MSDTAFFFEKDVSGGRACLLAQARAQTKSPSPSSQVNKDRILQSPVLPRELDPAVSITALSRRTVSRNESDGGIHELEKELSARGRYVH